MEGGLLINGRKRNKGHDEHSVQHIQVFMSEIVSSIDVHKATGNGLPEKCQDSQAICADTYSFVKTLSTSGQRSTSDIFKPSN